MTPTELAAWLGGISAGLMGLMKVIAFTMEQLGLRPSDRRAERISRLAEAEAEIERLKKEIADHRKRIEDLEDELRQERRNVDFLERMLTRQGYRKGPNGWQDENNKPGGTKQ